MVDAVVMNLYPLLLLVGLADSTVMSSPVCDDAIPSSSSGRRFSNSLTVCPALRVMVRSSGS